MLPQAIKMEVKNHFEKERRGEDKKSTERNPTKIFFLSCYRLVKHCREVISSTSHFTNLPFHQPSCTLPAISLTHHFIKLLSEITYLPSQQTSMRLSPTRWQYQS
jgi:hypothetical protein